MRMKILIAVVAFGLGVATAYARALPRPYQVTGPVLTLAPDMVTVQKDGCQGPEKWEIARGTATKTTGTPKIGDTVTVMYRMSATSIEVKPGK